MTHLGHHIILRFHDDRPIAETALRRRALARAVYRVRVDAGLLAFGCADSHLHLLVTGDRPEAGRFAQAVMQTLRPVLARDADWEAARIVPLNDQQHRRHAFRYVLRQREHHGLAPDPCAEGSSLPDLLGLRLTGAHLLPRVRVCLPRVSERELLELMHVDELREGVEVGFVDEAAAAAVGLPDLRGRRPEAEAARVAAVHALGTLTTSVQPFGVMALGVSKRTWRRLRAKAANPALVRAIRLQMSLRHRCASASKG